MKTTTTMMTTIDGREDFGAEGGFSVGLVVTAAGASQRFGSKKEFAQVSAGGKRRSVLCATVSAFLQARRFSKIVVSMTANLVEEARRLLSELDADCEISVVPGGATRQKSVFLALQELAKTPPDYVLIHDGARPFVSADLIARAVDGAARFGAVCPVVKSVDSPKICGGNREIVAHLKRDTVFNAQTPQAFRFAEIFAAHESAAGRGDFTDDASIYAEKIGPVRAIDGEESNIKITFPRDLFGRE